MDFTKLLYPIFPSLVWGSAIAAAVSLLEHLKTIFTKPC